MRAAQDALRAAEQEDVEWAEDDMNDPALLAEMERLERGEEVDSSAHAASIASQATQSTRLAPASVSLPASRPAQAFPVETVAEDEEYLSQLSNLLQLRMREYHDAAMAAKQSGSPAVKQLATVYGRLKEMKRQMEEEGALIDEDDIPGPPPSSSDVKTQVVAPQPKSNPNAMQQSPVASAKGSASNSKTNSPASVSSTSQLSRKSSQRMEVDEGYYVVPMQGLQSENEEQEDEMRPAKRVAPLSQSLMSGGSSMMTSTPSVMSTPPKLTDEEIRERKFGQLESVLLTQLEEMKKAAVEASSQNKKTEALAIIHRRKLLLKDLELTRYARATKGVRPPAFHIEETKTERELINEDVSALELEIGVLRIDGVSPPSLDEKVLSCYVVIEIPIPDPSRPTTITTHTVSDSLDPSFKFTQKIRIERTKALLRTVQKKKISFAIYKPKSWFLGSTRLIGRAEMKIAKLQEDAEIHEALEVMEERPGNKNLGGGSFHGGKLHASVRLRTPLVKRMVITETHKTLVIDKHFIGEDGEIDFIGQSQASSSSSLGTNGPNTPTRGNNGTPQHHPSSRLPASPDLTVSTVASLTSVAPSSRHGDESSMDHDLTVSRALAEEDHDRSNNHLQGQSPSHSPRHSLERTPSGMLIDEHDSDMQVDSGDADQSDREAKDVSDENSNFSTPLTPHVVDHSSNITSPNDEKNQSPANASSSSGAAVAPKDDFDFNSAGWMTSFAVLEWRKGELAKEIAALKKEKKTPAIDEQIEEKEDSLGAVEHKCTILITLVQSGQLSQDEYIRRVKKKLVEEEELNQRLGSVDRLAEALLCRKRIQIMKEELSEAGM